MTREQIFIAFSDERRRQEVLKAQGRFKYTPADPELSHTDRFAILGEEFGEIGGAVVQGSGLSSDRTDQGDVEALRKELIQLGAVVTAWLEAL